MLRLQEHGSRKWGEVAPWHFLDSEQLADHQRGMENCSPQHCYSVLPIIAQVIVGASAKILNMLGVKSPEITSPLSL
jgi:hypothetical protein